MNKGLTPIQADLLRLAQTRDLGKMSYRQMAEHIGGEHPYSVQLALQRLVKEGRLIINKRSKTITPLPSAASADTLLNIPIMGRVSCGVATEIADNEPRGFIAVSPSLVDARYASKTFALIAAGDSMDRASIGNKNVENGDYVVVRKSEWGEAKDGQYVVSRYGNANNLKRLRIDSVHSRLILLSESSDPRPPIVIAQEDLEYYAIEGVAIDVIKKLPEPA